MVIISGDASVATRFTKSPNTNVSKAYWFSFSGSVLLLSQQGEQFTLPFQQSPPVEAEAVTYCREIGQYNGHPCLLIEIPDESTPDGLERISLREAYGCLGEDLWAMAGKASQILRWRKDHQFCGRCGAEMHEETQELLCRCPQCDFVTYPRISPAVIMSVVHEDRILLGRAPHFPPKMYSVLAGFVEPGETLEQAVEREVWEETAVRIRDIRYFGSQPWPFPHSLMVGFQSHYHQGELKVDTKELEDAAWFTADNLPRLPTPISISRRLIDQFLHEQRS